MVRSKSLKADGAYLSIIKRILFRCLKTPNSTKYKIQQSILIFKRRAGCFRRKQQLFYLNCFASSITYSILTKITWLTANKYVGIPKRAFWWSWVVLFRGESPCQCTSSFITCLSPWRACTEHWTLEEVFYVPQFLRFDDIASHMTVMFINSYNVQRGKTNCRKKTNFIKVNRKSSE